MSRSTCLLIAGIYSTLLALTMLFAPEATARSYGALQVDLSHISIMQFLGLNTGGFALLGILNRNAPNSVSLRSVLLCQGILLLAGIALGLYQMYSLHVPLSAVFVADSSFRLILGLGLLYFYYRETKLAQAGAVLV